MSGSNVTLNQLVNTLQAENLLSAEDDALAYLENRSTPQPWYIRTMVGFGAWLASLLLIGFVTSFTLMFDGGYIFIGAALIVCAILVRQRSDSDFMVQCALASSLAGQALVAYGFADIAGYEEFEIFLGFALVMSTVLFFLFPDRIHRVIMVLLATGSLTTLLYVWEMNALVPLLGPALTGILILLHNRMPRLVTSRYGELLQPLMSGLMLSAFGTLLLSTVYLLPELEADFLFYPRPWISTILLGLLFIYLGRLIWPVIADTENTKSLPLLYGMMIVIIACAWYAPGLLLGLIVTLLGAHSGRVTFTGAGIGFFVLFLTAFFYGIEVSLLTKSITLITTGIAILASRWIILKIIPTNETQGADHA
ncbi:MAG: DUF4401 domain-containing protein [Candidatus Thiodiazotropha sp. (ex Semelilucina semeliformis)]|nr:DUF4401 domain-containing protein [Candidatus Thiodiazotropha sp. (ex Semelilucina semeliformis)]